MIKKIIIGYKSQLLPRVCIEQRDGFPLETLVGPGTRLPRVLLVLFVLMPTALCPAPGLSTRDSGPPLGGHPPSRPSCCFSSPCRHLAPSGTAPCGQAGWAARPILQGQWVTHHPSPRDPHPAKENLPRPPHHHLTLPI